MGGDGGTFAVKRAYVRGAKTEEKEESKNLKQQQLLRTRLCTHSGESLRLPISCCELGNLYNTESIISALLDKKVSAAASHVRNMKDLKQLKLFPNPNYSPDDEVDGELPAMFSCPITKMEFNGNHPFVAIWSTGYVLSEKAIKELGIEALQSEYGPFQAEDLVKLIPTQFELEAQTAQMVQRRNKRKAEKASKKEHRSTEEAGDADVSQKEKRKRKHTEGEEGSNGKNKLSSSTSADGSSGGVSSISKSASLVKCAANVIKDQEQHSTVFKGLFHKDKEKDKHDRDLFMSVAGIRYTLG